mmetsp:Transcript_10283/g.31440  ORF Transcript_10283/g.31440 Transcript_10283/m.31440 type:complete len:421 (-) Transcript_10283:396-1658(-)|eukprot:CAMPEP_0198723446 /NCGR_PEP_ID=MMETSP1475-20131203/951_1 /TAXON_ID= ORGANISM="Unidentified sp., Strain CCMP1999" /NCGR_SAMPLE_ID=MMETSP1475 /ASSEMBLY_ACC=CAM_ASM_001111 /LENGTH=420 /DNA_ID=CAMNT_0044484567 /DNA_START=289 /DNA_END=1551 /DNA_ORIENTATION=+
MAAVNGHHVEAERIDSNLGFAERDQRLREMALARGRLREMALAKGRLRLWGSLSAQSVSTLARTAAEKLPPMSSINALSGENYRYSCGEVRQRTLEHTHALIDKENSASKKTASTTGQSSKKGSPIQAQSKPPRKDRSVQQARERSRTEPSKPDRTATKFNSQAGDRSPKGERSTQARKMHSRSKTREKRMLRAGDDAEVDRLTARFKFAMDMRLDETTQRAHRPETFHWEEWLSCYFKVSNQTFTTRKEDFASILYTILDNNVTKDRLGSRVSLEWNKRFNTTAGMTHFRMRKISRERFAGIVLSTKVLDSPIKLYRTLVHEMCHAAQWVIDGKPKPPHGPPFKAWVYQFRQFDPTLDITTCHQYEIDYKYRYECESCHHTYGRHSKSINVERKVCGNCRGKLHLLPVGSGHIGARPFS